MTTLLPILRSRDREDSQEPEILPSDDQLGTSYAGAPAARAPDREAAYLRRSGLQRPCALPLEERDRRARLLLDDHVHSARPERGAHQGSGGGIGRGDLHDHVLAVRRKPGDASAPRGGVPRTRHGDEAGSLQGCGCCADVHPHERHSEAHAQLMGRPELRAAEGSDALKTKLPKPLASYFEAVNREDVESMLVPFAANAVVKDEGKTWSGVPELREWIEEVTEKYHPRFEVEDVVTEGAEAAIVIGLVSGTFPGSPVRLHYTFRLTGQKITHLEIK